MRVRVGIVLVLSVLTVGIVVARLGLSLSHIVGLSDQHKVKHSFRSHVAYLLVSSKVAADRESPTALGKVAEEGWRISITSLGTSAETRAYAWHRCGPRCGSGVSSAC